MDADGFMPRPCVRWDFDASNADRLAFQTAVWNFRGLLYFGAFDFYQLIVCAGQSSDDAPRGKA